MKLLSTKSSKAKFLKAALLLALIAPGASWGQVIVPSSDIIPDIGGYWTNEVSFWAAPDSGSKPVNQVNNSGLMTSRITHSSGTTDVWSLCADYHEGFDENSSYMVTGGFGPHVSKTEIKQLDLLFANVLPSFAKAIALGDTARAEVIASAMQMTYWEIIEDENELLVLDHDSVDAGTFQVDYDYASSDPDTILAIKEADSFLYSIREGQWSTSQTSSYDFYYADSSTGQDRLWIATAGSPVPEPSGFALIGLGGVALLLRRRR